MSTNEGEGAVCIANIGPRERRKRLTFGVASLAVGAAGAAALALSGTAVAWRAALFLPFVSAGLGFFQWREQT
jgi:hypothetical protein